MEELQKKKLKALISELARVRGRHTELVTVYIPAGFNLSVVVNQLRQEQSTAQNIKSKTVRKNVLAALERILQHLKLYKQTPPNGLAVFCGNISEQEGAARIEIWAIEPPEPVKVRLYRCDQTFILDPLKELIREKEIYGLIVLDKSEADIALLAGKRIEILKHLESLVPGKTKKGGQSAARFARVREGLLFDFLKKVGEVANAQFRDMRDLKGIIIGGPGPIKDRFFEESFLEADIKSRVLGVVSTSYTGEYGVRELVERAEDVIAKSAIIQEKKILDRFFDEFARDTGLAAYGLDEVLTALKSGNVEILLISEAFDWVRVKLECSCGYKEERTVMRADVRSQTCPKCGAKIMPGEQVDLLDEIVKTAEQMGTHVEMISTHTRKGQQLKELGGIAGILRYKVS